MDTWNNMADMHSLNLRAHPSPQRLESCRHYSLLATSRHPLLAIPIHVSLSSSPLLCCFHLTNSSLTIHTAVTPPTCCLAPRISSVLSHPIPIPHSLWTDSKPLLHFSSFFKGVLKNWDGKKHVFTNCLCILPPFLLFCSYFFRTCPGPGVILILNL